MYVYKYINVFGLHYLGINIDINDMRSLPPSNLIKKFRGINLVRFLWG